MFRGPCSSRLLANQKRREFEGRPRREPPVIPLLTGRDTLDISLGGALRITIGVAEVASGASNLSEARRGARDSKTLEFARVRVREQMERSEMVRERAKDRAPEPQRRGAEWLRLVIRRSGASPAEATDGRSRSPSTSTPAFPPKNSHTNTSIEQCRNSILRDKSGFFNQNVQEFPSDLSFPARSAALI
jgi:hypothetical protein